MRIKTWPFVLILLSTVVSPAVVTAAQYYVAPNGSSTANGSISNPWDIKTGVSKINAGDTLWVRGGTYTVSLNLYQSGTAQNPIIVRGYPGERATLDSTGAGGGQAATFAIYGSYVWLWDLELTSSDPVRTSSQTGSFPTDIARKTGASNASTFNTNPGIKLINLLVHDGFNGLGVWVDALDAEAYGNIIYNNGWFAPDRGHGHGIYSQNQTGNKRIVNNIIFNQFSHGIHIYTQNGYLDNFYLDGNTIFNNGSAADYFTRNILIGGNRAENPTVINNYTYFTPSVARGENNIGYVDGIGCNNLNASNNYFVGNTALKLVSCSNVTMNGNTFYGATSGFTSTQFPNNTYHASRPSGTKVFVRPNQYEPGRANITIYNWDLQNVVQADVSGIGLAVGEGYEVRDVQNFYGPPLVTGVYAGGAISIPMTSTSVAQPVGNAPFVIPHTSPEFGAFVVRKTAGSGPSDTTAPTTPTNPQAAAASATQINLSWTASTDNVAVTGYKIYRSGSQIGTSSTLSYQNTGLSPATSYSYTVAAYDAAGNTSNQSSAVSATTQPAADVTPPIRSSGSPSGALASGTTQVTLSLVTNEASTCKYGTTPNTVYPSMAGTFSQSGGTLHSTTLSGLQGGNSYNYYVRCQDLAGNSNTNDFSISFSVGSSADTTPPGIPTNPQAAAVSATQINLFWTASTDNVAVTGYKIYRGGVQVATSSTVSYQDSSLSPATSYSYTVAAYDAAGNTSNQSSAVSATTQPTADVTPPTRSSGSPSGALVSGTTQATLSLVTNEAATCRYATAGNVLYSSMTGVFSQTGGTSHNTTLSGLVNGASYSYFVRCQDAKGNTNNDDFTIGFSIADSLPSSPLYTYLEAETGSLLSPMGVSSHAGASGSQYISSSSSDNGSAQYTVNITTPGTYVLWGRVWAPSASGDSFFVSVDGGLEDIYDVAEGIWSDSWQWTRVNGRNGGSPLSLNPRTFSLSAGNHIISFRAREANANLDRILLTNDLSFIPSDPTQSPADATSPTAPTNLSGKATNSSSVSLSWSPSTDNVGVAGYYVYRDGAQIGSTVVTSYESKDLAPGVAYTYTVVAYDAAGNKSVQPNSITVTTQTLLPAPLNVRVF